MKIAGKHFVLTGASGGIGAAMARRLARGGARLLLLGRDEGRLAQLLRELGGAAAGHSLLAGDLCEPATRAALVAHCRRLPHPIDGLINNAGASVFAPLEGLDDAELEHLLAVNLLLPMQLIRDLLPLLRARPEAVIVNVGSTFGSIGYAGFSAYCAGKFGLRGFTEALRRELADSDIAVQYLAPRATRTGLNSAAVEGLNAALGNAVDTPERVADGLVALLESKRPARFLGWPERLFARLNQIAPGLVDGALRKQLATIRTFFAPAQESRP